MGNKIYIKGSTWIESDVCPTFHTYVDEQVLKHHVAATITTMEKQFNKWDGEGMYVETRKQSKIVKRVVEVQGSRRKLKQTDPKIMVRALFDLALQEHGVHHTSSTPKRIFNHLAPIPSSYSNLNRENIQIIQESSTIAMEVSGDHALRNLARKLGPTWSWERCIASSSPHHAFASQATRLENHVLQWRRALYGDHWEQMHKICNSENITSTLVQSFGPII
ncbi:hypothetical protein OROHE_005837 [Orobanche hederae]